MKKTFLLAAAIAVMLPAVSRAETIKFPSEAPIASVTIPDSWGPKETESGVDATSADSAVYFSIDIADKASVDKVVEDAIVFLTKNGVTVDKKTEKDTSDTKINGMDAATVDLKGTDKDGPVDVGLAVIAPSEDKVLVVTYWGSQGDDDKHDNEVSGILASLKPVK